MLKMMKKDKTGSAKVSQLKTAIKNKTYNWSKAIEGAAERIASCPESLAWK